MFEILILKNFVGIIEELLATNDCNTAEAVSNIVESCAWSVENGEVCSFSSNNLTGVPAGSVPCRCFADLFAIE